MVCHEIIHGLNDSFVEESLLELLNRLFFGVFLATVSLKVGYRCAWSAVVPLSLHPVSLLSLYVLTGKLHTLTNITSVWSKGDEDQNSECLSDNNESTLELEQKICVH